MDKISFSLASCFEVDFSLGLLTTNYTTVDRHLMGNATALFYYVDADQQIQDAGTVEAAGK